MWAWVTEIIKFGSKSISCVVQEALLSGRQQAQFNGMGMHECVLRTGWGGLLWHYGDWCLLSWVAYRAPQKQLRDWKPLPTEETMAVSLKNGIYSTLYSGTRRGGEEKEGKCDVSFWFMLRGGSPRERRVGVILPCFLPQSLGDLVLACGLGKKWGPLWLWIEQRVHLENEYWASWSGQSDFWRARPSFLCFKVKPPQMHQHTWSVHEQQ